MHQDHELYHDASPALASERFPSFAQLFMDVRDPVVVLSPLGRCIFHNQTFTELVAPEDPALADADHIPCWVEAGHRERWKALIEFLKSDQSALLEQLSVALDLNARGQVHHSTVVCNRVASTRGEMLAVVAVIRTPHATNTREIADATRALSEIREYLHNRQSERPSKRLFTCDATLSKREADILQQLLIGKRVSTIASQLFLSEHTVRNYIKRIYKKLGVHSAAELRELGTATTAPEILTR